MTSDLIPTNISLGSTTIAPAGSLFVSWSILNQGSTAANASSTTELRITSSPTSAAGTNLAGVSTSALGAGASQFESAFLTAPTTPGTYYVWVIADDFSTVSNQSNTTNDLQHSIAFTVSPPPPPPPPAAQSDLIPTNISLGSTTIAPGGSLSVNWSILNQGSGAANSSSTTELRITSSPTATGTAADNLLGVSTSALGAGASQFESATLTAPTAPGTYYVWVIADDFSNVTNQSNTANDFQHSAAFTVSPPPPPLEPTLSSVSPSSYPASTSGQLMELFGSNFAVGDKLLYTFPSGATGFNLSPLTIVSSSEIDYSQFNDGSTPGTWKVQVEGPDGTLSSAVSFTVSPPPASPSPPPPPPVSPPPPPAAASAAEHPHPGGRRRPDY